MIFLGKSNCWKKLNSGCADIEKNVEHFGFEILQFYLASVADNLIKHP